jgi:di/tricarboxylate transporter
MPLTPHALAALALTICALILFSRERIPLEYSATAILVTIVMAFELFPLTGPVPLRGAHFLEGFGNDALITICLLLILARGVEVSGGLRPIGRLLTRIWLFNRVIALLVTLVIAAFVSAFANNTPIVVMLLPILVGVAHRTNVSTSKILMPVGFATIIGGMSTTIGTSTNLLVVSVSEELGLERLQMFDFTLPAVLAAGAGILYLWLLAPYLLPDRPSLLAGTKPRIFDSVVTIEEDSPIVGQTLSDVMQKMSGQIRLTRIERGESLELVRLPTSTLKAGDRLHFRGSPEDIKATLTRDSPLHRRRLSEVQRETLRGLDPIGWYRPGQRMLTSIEKSSDPLLRTGDVLLMQGPRQEIQQLMATPHILILARRIHVHRTANAPIAVSIMVGVVIVAALGILPIIASALCGVGLMFLARCLTWSESWGAIDKRMVLVIVASLALGVAIVGTGAAEFLAHAFVVLTEGLPPPVILSGLILLTALLTEVVTNNAIAVIATPIAMAIAAELGLPPLPFVLAVLFGANMSYLTPIGYQTNLLVMSSGNYRFADFFRAGLPLQLILWLALSFILPALYL